MVPVMTPALCAWTKASRPLTWSLTIRFELDDHVGICRLQPTWIGAPPVAATIPTQEPHVRLQSLEGDPGAVR